MGIARLLAKGWIIFCLFAGAHALRFAILQGMPLDTSLAGIGICALLFTAMGLLFVGGFGASGAQDPAVLLDFLNHGWAQQQPAPITMMGDSAVAEGDACGPDGC